jgi:hypothetical protein
LKRQKNSFSSFDCTWVGDIRQTEMLRAEPFVPEPSATEVDIATGKFKRYRLPGVDQIPAKLLQMGKEHCVLRFISLLS